MKAWMEKNMWFWSLVGSLVLWGAIGVCSKSLSLNSLLSSLTLASFTLLLALAQMVVITSGNGAIDLSTTYVMTISAYISCTLMQYNILLGFAGALLAGVLVGVVNGLINIYLKVPVMITTLATGYIIYSLILILSSYMQTLPDQRLVKVMIKKYGPGLSNLSLICLAIAVLLGILLYKTKYGRQLHAVGQNRIAAKYAGTSVTRTVLITFILSGVISALSGVFCGAYIGGAFPDMGTSYFLPSVAAAMVGGTAASGGKSSVVGAVLGAFMMSLLTTFLNVTQLAPGYQKLIQGVVLVLVLVASASRRTNKS